MKLKIHLGTEDGLLCGQFRKQFRHVARINPHIVALYKLDERGHGLWLGPVFDAEVRNSFEIPQIPGEKNGVLRKSDSGDLEV
jgi:hypothetical protein